VTIKRTRFRRGFTLIEVLLVIVIIAILAAIAIPNYMGHVKDAEIVRARTDIRAIQNSITIYNVEFRTFPPDLAEIGEDGRVDPWGNPYRYLDLNSGAPGTSGKRRRDKKMNPINSDYDLYSVGPDGDSSPQLVSKKGRDDIVRANDGEFIGLASEY
jgi:general secretion pathway protein G